MTTAGKIRTSTSLTTPAISRGRIHRQDAGTPRTDLKPSPSERGCSGRTVQPGSCLAQGSTFRSITEASPSRALSSSLRSISGSQWSRPRLRSQAHRPSKRRPDREDQSPKHGRWDGRLWVRDAAKEHEQILARNGDRALKQPETALDALARSQATFTRRDMASYLASHMDAERVSLALDKLVNSEHAIFLGRDHDGADRFTTKRHMETEAETLQAAITLSNRTTHQVSQEHARAPSLSRQMGREQEAAYRYLTQDSGDIAVVQGYAGAGKTYLLGAAKEAWEAQGFRVIGATLAAKAAQGLEAEAGIKSRTIASMLRSLDGPKAAHPGDGQGSQRTDRIGHRRSRDGGHLRLAPAARLRRRRPGARWCLRATRSSCRRSRRAP